MVARATSNDMNAFRRVQYVIGFWPKRRIQNLTICNALIKRASNRLCLFVNLFLHEMTEAATLRRIGGEFTFLHWSLDDHTALITSVQRDLV